jgi:hypothetical protein
MLFAFIICLLIIIGNLDKAVSSPTGLPLIEVYHQAMKSNATTKFLSSSHADYHPVYGIVQRLCVHQDWFGYSQGTTACHSQKTLAYVSLFQEAERWLNMLQSAGIRRDGDVIIKITQHQATTTCVGKHG